MQCAMHWNRCGNGKAGDILLPVSVISNALGVPMDTSDEMINHVTLWGEMLKGKSPWLIEKESHARSTGISGAVASEFARLVTIENEITVSGSPRADFISQQIDSLRDCLRQEFEFGVAEGGLIFKPYVSKDQILIDYARQDSFYPISYDDSRLSAVAFVQRMTRGNQIYTKLEYHHMEPDGCHIDNKAFVRNTLAKDAQVLGDPVQLSDVDEWKDIVPSAVLSGTDRLLLGYYRNPAANTVDFDSQMGVSCYAKAVPIIKQADEQWGRVLWEYEGSELAVHADETLFKKEPNGEVVLPKGKERLYRNIPGLDEDNRIDTFSPTIRDTSLFNGMNEVLRRIEFVCGLAYGTLSNVQDAPQTATQINASKQRSYSTVHDMQKSLQNALDDLIYAIDFWATVSNLVPQGAYQTAYDWDDSIVNEPSQRKQMFWQYVVAGKFPMWRYLMEFESYTEEDAKAIASEAQQGQVDPFADGGAANVNP